MEAGLWIVMWCVQSFWCAEKKPRVTNDRETVELCFSFSIAEVESINSALNIEYSFCLKIWYAQCFTLDSEVESRLHCPQMPLLQMDRLEIGSVCVYEKVFANRFLIEGPLLAYLFLSVCKEN